jgi:hypothetical protein
VEEYVSQRVKERQGETLDEGKSIALIRLAAFEKGLAAKGTVVERGTVMLDGCFWRVWT